MIARRASSLTGIGIGGWAAIAGSIMALAGTLLFWASEGASIFAQSVVTSFLNCF